jgi:hypothetical protein
LLSHNRDTHPIAAVLAIQKSKYDLTLILARIVHCANNALAISIYKWENAGDLPLNGLPLVLAVSGSNSPNLRNAIGGGQELREHCPA